MIQFYGVPRRCRTSSSNCISPPAYRAYGNVAQPNLYANYLALGGTALLFLWQRASLRTAFALAAAMLLAWACALSGSRAALLYALWFALLGAFAGRTQTGIDARRLKFAAYGLAGVLLSAPLPYPGSTMRCISAPRTRRIRTLAKLSSDRSEAAWHSGAWPGIFSPAPRSPAPVSANLLAPYSVRCCQPN